MKKPANASAPLCDNSAAAVDIDHLSNPLIQDGIPESLSKIASALHEIKSQFVFDDDDISSVQMSVSMCNSIVDILSQIMEAIRHAENEAVSMRSTGIELLKSATKLCDDLDQLMAAQQFYYLAVETMFQKRKAIDSDDYGASVFSQWLCEECLNAVNQLHRMQDMLRSLHCRSVEG